MTLEPDKVLTHLLEVTRKVAAAHDVDAALLVILSAATELTESESASLLEYDEATLELFFRFVPWFHREAVTMARVPLNGSVAGWVFLNAQSLVVDDTLHDPLHYKKVDELAEFTTTSLVGVPLLVHGKPIGVLEVFNKKDKYAPEDIAILEALAVLAATALKNEALTKRVLAFQDEARTLDKMKNEFIAITSHELRTPLGLILGYSTFLKELLGTQHEEQVDAIIRNASRLKEIIESLTSVDNYQTGSALVRSRKVSIARIIDDVCVSFAAMADQKSINIRRTIPAGQEMWVDVDGSKVAIVLGNLVKNAIAFSNEGSEIVIQGEQYSDHVQVSVQDSGIGIPSKDLPHIFERFYQVESHLTRRHGGMGLGLSVAKVMIEMHGGRIWAESEEGHGSTFSFILPLRADELPPSWNTLPFTS